MHQAYRSRMQTGNAQEMSGSQVRQSPVRALWGLKGEAEGYNYQPSQVIGYHISDSRRIATGADGLRRPGGAGRSCCFKSKC